ncbi:MAG: hypothetical protein HY699_06085 [Deltaproteobacteria bacterium]|nr:hypothetical protein [Deltaproteobacteria bacterium]
MLSSLRLRLLAGGVLPMLLSVAVYSSTLRNGFIWDDPMIVERQLPAFHDWRSLFLPPAELEFAGTYYRPLIFATYWFDNWLGQGAPWAFHLTPVAAHVLVTLLVFLLGIGLRMAALPAGLAAALFAVHPIHTESVAWMAGRSDVLAALFLLLAVLVLWRGGRAGGVALAAGAVLLAMLCKETAAFGALVLPVAAALSTKAKGASRRGWIAVSLAVPVYICLRIAAGATAPRQPGQPVDPAALLALIGFYGGKLIAPFDLNVLVMEVHPLALYLGLSAALLGAGVRYWRRARGDPAGRFLLAWCGITLVPAALPLLWPVAAAPFAERYAYLPSVGFCLLAIHVGAGWAAANPRRLRVGGVVALVLLTLGAVATVSRNAVWRDDLSFWKAAAIRNPSRWLPRFELAKAYAAARQPTAAEATYRAALVQADAVGLPLILNNLGALARQAGHESEAEGYLRQAAAARADYPDPLYNLGVLYWNRGKAALERGDSAAGQAAFAAARQQLEAALRLSPHLTAAHYALGSLAVMMGDVGLARDHLEMTIQLAPHSREAVFARQVAANLPAVARQ